MHMGHKNAFDAAKAAVSPDLCVIIPNAIPPHKASFGLVSGEHGIGSGKIRYLVDSVGETNMELMRGIKKVFDPKMILNPGKVCVQL